MADRIVQVNLTGSNSQNPFSPHSCLLPQAGHGILWLESSILSFSVAEYPDILVIGVGMWTSGIFVASLLLADSFCVGMFFSSCQALSESKGPEDFLLLLWKNTTVASMIDLWGTQIISAQATATTSLL